MCKHLKIRRETSPFLCAMVSACLICGFGPLPAMGPTGPSPALVDIVRQIESSEHPNVLGGYPITQFVVGPKGLAGYQTIQAAIDAAVKSGGVSQAVFVQPGDYKEDLDFSGATSLGVGLTLVGATALGDEGQVEIIGTHTPPASGTLILRNFRLSSGSAIFSSQNAGNGHIVIIDAELNVANGYTFDLPKWEGIFELFDINPGTGNDGGINNVGGATLFMFCAGLGSGTNKSMHLSGPVIVGEGDISCPVNFGKGSVIQMDNVQFAYPITFSDDAKGALFTSRLTGGDKPAITMSSSGDVTIGSSVIQSSSDLAIVGTGSGNLKLAGVSYVNSAGVEAGLALDRTATFETGSVYMANLSFDRGAKTISANGELVIGDQSGTPRISTLTPGDGIEITNGPGSITISQKSKLEATGRTVGVETVDLITLPLGNTPGTYVIEGRISGYENTRPAGIGCVLSGVVRTTGSVGSMVGAPRVICDSEGPLDGAGVNMVVSGNKVVVQATGVRGLTIDWGVQLEHTVATPKKQHAEAGM